MGGASSRAAGRSYKSAKDAAAKAVSAAAREKPVVPVQMAAAPAASPNAASVQQHSEQPRHQPVQDTLRPGVTRESESGPAGARHAQRPESMLPQDALLQAQRPESTPAQRPESIPERAWAGGDIDAGRDETQAAMLDQLSGAIKRRDGPQPGSAEVTTQRRQPRPPDDRPPFSIEDFRTLMQAAQSAAVAGRTADVEALAARFRVDAQTLRAALASTSLPLIRKNEQGYMFAESAAPSTAQWQPDADATFESAMPQSPEQQQPLQQPAMDPGTGAGLNTLKQGSAAEPQPGQQPQRQGGKMKKGGRKGGVGEDIRDTSRSPQARPASWG